MTDIEALGLVECELAESRQKHSRPLSSAHEGYAVLLEAMTTVWTEIIKPREHRKRNALLAGLLTVSSVAIRTAVDCCSEPPYIYQSPEDK